MNTISLIYIIGVVIASVINYNLFIKKRRLYNYKRFNNLFNNICKLMAFHNCMYSRILERNS